MLDLTNSQNLQAIQIADSATILQAIEQLNALSGKHSLILFVHDSNGTIIGSLTDGDIRRALIRHQDLAITVGAVCNRQFTAVQQSKDYLELSSFRKRNLKIVPVLDNEGKLVDYIDLEQQHAQLPLECVIMAGGRGKRLSPLTDDTPKPMLILGGQPLIERNIDRLIQFGIKKIYISVKYLGQQIVDCLGDGSQKGIEIEYVWEDKPLGTAGALSLIDNFQSEHVLVMNGDLLTNVDFEKMYHALLKSDADMVVASTEYKIDVPYAIFETDGNQIIDFEEKPSKVYHANAGIYILKKQLIERIPKNQCYDMPDLMEVVVKTGDKLIYSPIVGYWIDIGKPSDYKQAQEFVSYLAQ